MKNIGLILDNLGPNAAAYLLIKSINEYLQEHDDVSPIIFYHNLSPYCINPLFATCTLFEAYSFQGVLISTNLNNASRSLEFIGCTQKIFYPIDLEWTKLQGQQNYEQLAHIYNNPCLPIIARSNNYRQILELTWNSNVIGVIEPDFNFSSLVKVILDYENKNN